MPAGLSVGYDGEELSTHLSCVYVYTKYFYYGLPLWAREPQHLGWGAELTHTATGEW